MEPFVPIESFLKDYALLRSRTTQRLCRRRLSQSSGFVDWKGLFSESPMNSA